MKLRKKIQRFRRAIGAQDGRPWFLAGYVAALTDMEQTGLRPTSPDSMRESADRALKAWVEKGDKRD